MPQGSRTGVRTVLILTLALGALVSDPAAAPDPVLPKSGETAPPLSLPRDSLVPDTTIFLRDTTRADRVRTDRVRASDSLAAGKRPAGDGAVRDSARAPRTFAWKSPLADVRDCKTG
ncbi:MAG TPA: hypothetical protein VJ385_23005, partial [Fibrobacteria bacterium]|nr:hypothetical protein [Fibrobacteria bacterium]